MKGWLEATSQGHGFVRVGRWLGQLLRAAIREPTRKDRRVLQEHVLERGVLRLVGQSDGFEQVATAGGGRAKMHRCGAGRLVTTD